MEFNPETATREEVLARAEGLTGKSLGEAVGDILYEVLGKANNKGNAGHLVEAYFRIKQNSDAGPDFPHAKIELKAVPLLKAKKKAFRSKERTKIKLINYMSLPDEQWDTGEIRKKLDSVLFIFFLVEPSAPVVSYPVVGYSLWVPDSAQQSDMKADWEAVRKKVCDGEAHLLSEGDGRFLGPARANDSILVPQPFNEELAKKRAWALKPTFTIAVFERLVAAKQKSAELSLRELLSLPDTSDFEEEVIARLLPFRGMRLREVGEALSISSVAGKDAASRIVRRALGIKSDSVLLKEFRERGIQVKTVPIGKVGDAYQAMSFPYFKFREMAAEESWEESVFSQYLQRLLIIPLFRRKESVPGLDALLGTPFFWSPSFDQLETIQKEWMLIRDLIRNEKADQLPSYGATEIIHARPKGQNSKDTDDAPGIGPYPKRALWLNPAFTARLVRENGGLSGLNLDVSYA